MTKDSINLVLSSWRPSTTKAYNTYIKKWQDYTISNRIRSPSHVHVCNFLAEMYKSGASHSTINLARSAVSAYLNRSNTDSVGQHPVVCRLVKGVLKTGLPYPSTMKPGM